MKTRFASIRCVGFCVAVCALVQGCGGGDGPPEVVVGTVSGMVKLDGKPLPTGTIAFIDSEKNATAGEIIDGKYEFDVSPGEKRVKIKAVVEYGEADETGVKATKETLPEKYNRRSTLKATVTAEGPNTINFDLESK